MQRGWYKEKGGPAPGPGSFYGEMVAVCPECRNRPAPAFENVDITKVFIANGAVPVAAYRGTEPTESRFAAPRYTAAGFRLRSLPKLQISQHFLIHIHYRLRHSGQTVYDSPINGLAPSLGRRTKTKTGKRRSASPHIAAPRTSSLFSIPDDDGIPNGHRSGAAETARAVKMSKNPRTGEAPLPDAR